MESREQQPPSVAAVVSPGRDMLLIASPGKEIDRGTLLSKSAQAILGEGRLGGGPWTRVRNLPPGCVMP